MKLATYTFRGQTRAGAVLGDQVVDLHRGYVWWMGQSGEETSTSLADAVMPSTLLAFLQRGDTGMQLAREVLVAVQEAKRSTPTERLLRERGVLFALEEVRLEAPIQRPPKIICMWVNYRAHGEEASIVPPTEHPIFFSKFATAVIGPHESIVIPRISQMVDYEAELALVIGKRGKDIAPHEVYDYIAGYTILNDVSARDYSLKRLLGVVGPSLIQKTFDTFAPLGPWIVTRDEIDDPHRLDIRLSIDGEILQDSNTRHMIFKIPDIVAAISQVVTLEPGDVISTGTPPGVGFARTPPRYLRPGERVRIEIERIGVLENPVAHSEEPEIEN